jgi:mannitol/fructose-specific phosphotransferase system IIA component (Ntr-type)
VDAVDRLVRQQEIPHQHRGSQVVFARTEIDAWASQRILGGALGVWKDFHRNASQRHERISKNHAILPDLVSTVFIEPCLQAKTRAAVLRGMTEVADRSGCVYDVGALLESLREREDLCSTAMEGGFALLHPRHHLEAMFAQSFIALGRTANPVPFGAPDGRTTDLFFLICCDHDKLHLHTLARLSQICRQTAILDELRASASAIEMAEALWRGEGVVIRAL